MMMNVSSSKNEFEKNGWMFLGFFWKDCDFKPFPKSKMKISEITHLTQRKVQERMELFLLPA